MPASKGSGFKDLVEALEASLSRPGNTLDRIADSPDALPMVPHYEFFRGLIYVKPRIQPHRPEDAARAQARDAAILRDIEERKREEEERDHAALRQQLQAIEKEEAAAAALERESATRSSQGFVNEAKAHALCMVLDEGVPVEEASLRTGIKLNSLRCYIVWEKRRRAAAAMSDETAVDCFLRRCTLVQHHSKGASLLESNEGVENGAVATVTGQTCEASWEEISAKQRKRRVTLKQTPIESPAPPAIPAPPAPESPSAPPEDCAPDESPPVPEESPAQAVGLETVTSEDAPSNVDKKRACAALVLDDGLSHNEAGARYGFTLLAVYSLVRTEQRRRTAEAAGTLSRSTETGKLARKPKKQRSWRRPSYTPQQLARAVSLAVDEGLSVPMAAAETGIPFNTLKEKVTRERIRRRAAAEAIVGTTRPVASAHDNGNGKRSAVALAEMADTDAGCPGPFQPIEDHADHEQQRPQRRLIDEWRERSQQQQASSGGATPQPLAVRLLQSADLRAFLELPTEAQDAIKLLLRLDAA